MNDNFEHSNCYRPVDIYAHIHNMITPEETVVKVCRRLHAMNLIEEISNKPNDPSKRESCYRISQLGIDKLNPNSREKGMFKMQKITTALAIITTIASVITVIVVLTQFQ